MDKLPEEKDFVISGLCADCRKLKPVKYMTDTQRLTCYTCYSTELRVMAERRAERGGFVYGAPFRGGDE